MITEPDPERSVVSVDCRHIWPGFRTCEWSLCVDETKRTAEALFEHPALHPEDHGVGASTVQAEDAWEVEGCVVHIESQDYDSLLLLRFTGAPRLFIRLIFLVSSGVVTPLGLAGVIIVRSILLGSYCCQTRVSGLDDWTRNPSSLKHTINQNPLKHIRHIVIEMGDIPIRP